MKTAVLDALPRQDRSKFEGANDVVIVLSCLQFKEHDTRGEQDRGHCGKHWRSVQRMAEKSFKNNRSPMEDALRYLQCKLNFECRKRGQRLSNVLIICWCKSGRDRSVGMVTTLHNCFAGTSGTLRWYRCRIMHICADDWRANPKCHASLPRGARSGRPH